MGLIHGNQGYIGILGKIQEFLGNQPFRSHVYNGIAAGFGVFQRFPVLSRCKGTVEISGMNAHIVQRSHLILH